MLITICKIIYLVILLHLILQQYIPLAKADNFFDFYDLS